MTPLIKCLEALTGPSREVDAEIAKAVGWSFEPEFLTLKWTSPNGEISRAAPPQFTSSLDAARSICQGAMIVYVNEIAADGLPYMQLCTSTDPPTVHDGIGATIEIAWCIAALKAREAANET